MDRMSFEMSPAERNMHLDKLHLHICLHFATMTSQTAMTKALKWSFQAKNDREFSTFFFFFPWFLNMTGRKISPVTNATPKLTVGKQNVVQCRFS